MGVRTPIGRGLIASVLALGMLVMVAQPASAGSVTGAIVVTAPSTITRDTSAVDATADVSTTENSTYDLNAAAPGVTVAFSDSSCDSLTAAVPTSGGGSANCTVDANGLVTITQDNNGTTSEALTVRVTMRLTVAPTVAITSTEDSTGQQVTLTVSGSPTGSTTGSLTDGTANTTIVPRTTGGGAPDAEIRVTTAAPSPTSLERGPLAKTTYSASFSRVGKINQTTAVDVQLLTAAAQGTSVSNPTVSNDASPDACTFVTAGSNCAKITFGSGVTSLTVTFDVSVPAAADVGSTSYAFKATYDPNGTDGSPLDVENGNSTSFTVLTDTAPDTTIDSGPGSTADQEAVFAFSSDDAGATFECELTGPGQSAGFTACTSPKTYSSLGDGEYTFSVRAKDNIGNADQTPATNTFTVDNTAPVTAIDGGPGTVNDGTAEYTFSSNESGTFECELTGPGQSAGFTACTSPKEYTGLADGEYTFSVRAVDAANNTDATPESDTFTMDGTAPTTTIDGGPGGLTDGTAEYTFSSDDSGATFECELTGPGQSAGFTACTSPKEYTGLGDGEYTFSVRAVDAANNTDATPETDSFSIDNTAPTTTIDGGPGSRNDGAAEFTFSSNESGTFECELTGPGQSAGFTSCSSPKEYTGLAEGDYTFSVRATDAANNTDATPETSNFTMDSTAPTTTIDSGPGSLDDGIVDFTFSSSEPIGATFECKLDGPGATTGAYEACNAGSKSYTGLADGEYTFYVRATDAANNTGADDTETFTLEFVAPPTSTCNGYGVTIEGTDANETIPGTAGDDVIAAKGGHDIVLGRGGNDVICGGTGNDQLYGGDGLDALLGEAGNDTLTGGTGSDKLAGGDGTSDRASYYDHTLAVNVTIGNVAMDDGNGTDGPTGARDRVYSTVEGVVGGPGDDYLVGTGIANMLDGVGGNDILHGLSGNDTLLGSAGNDKAVGGYGRDSIYGGTGADSLYGQGDSDFLHAKDNARDARIDGGIGSDTAYRDAVDPAPISVP